MPCVQMGNVIACTPSAFTYRAIKRCPSCKRRTRHLVSMFVWYGDDVTCLGCGNSWSEGYMRQAGKKERARQQERGKAQWPLAATREAAMAALMDEVRIYTEPDPAESTTVQ